MIKILDVRIDNINKKGALEKVKLFLEDGKSVSADATSDKPAQYKIFTPNPEMLVDAQKDVEFKEVLNSGDLNVCDGFGLSLVSGCGRIPGVDFMQGICALAEKQGKSVYLLGSGSDEVVKRTVEVLQSKHSKLKIVGCHKGPNIQCSMLNIKYFDETENNDVLDDIIMSAPEILFVAFGHNKQEKWINENLKHLPSVKIAMGVGGAFDYISGKIRRAPLFLRKIGLEWMYRLFRQPRRAGRVWKATARFLFLFFKNSL